MSKCTKIYGKKKFILDVMKWITCQLNVLLIIDLTKFVNVYNSALIYNCIKTYELLKIIKLYFENKKRDYWI